MKKIFITLLSALLLLTAVGCNKTSPVTSDNTDKDSEKGGTEEQLSGFDNYDEFLADIYLCDDVYRTDDMPTHGSGSILLPMAQDILELKNYDILLCPDGCPPESVVSRASQGYAPVYHVVPDGEIDGNFKVLKFKMEIPEPMLEDLKKQGVYEQITEEIESQYYYLIVLDEKHYAYIHLERKEGASKPDNEAELADSIVKNARIRFEPKNEKLNLTVESVVRLAENKGEELTWDDFAMYSGTDIGSGLYILKYEIDKSFYLLVGGVPGTEPMYIRLVSKLNEEKYIDIRTDDVEAFISENRELISENEKDSNINGDKWGLTVSADDVTASGMTLQFEHFGKAPEGQLETGEWYKLERTVNDEWQDVETVISDYGFDSVAYIIRENDITEFSVNWEWLYGKLPSGFYRMSKEVMNFRDTGDYDKEIYLVHFTID